ncbi:MAG: hypothetical protein KGP29_06910 [Proteobacteria bacterium]|nr:hypothetical protein [Pseudomonadota bacterium]
MLHRIFIFLSFLFSAGSSLAALPFVTDDAAIADLNQASIEGFAEYWHLPEKHEQELGNLAGGYLGVSYGAVKNLELTLGGLVGYNFHNSNVALANPIFQAKTMVFAPKNLAIPSVALEAGYVDKRGRDQYFDSATNTYALAVATSKFLEGDFIIHVNSGVKSSHNIDQQSNVSRMHLGVAVDAALISSDFRFIAESYNGTPNSPRDSPGFFHSYQVGFRFIKSSNLSFHILTGSQPTFVGYSDLNNDMLYRRTRWVQVGVRKVIDDLF